MSTPNALKLAATGKAAATEKPKDLAHLMAMPAVQAQIKAALPRHMTAERMARIATTELRKNPKLAQCEPITAEVHRKRSSWWTRIIQAISFFLVTSADYSITRRLNLGRV